MKVVSFYRFVSVADPGALRLRLLAQCEDLGLLGTILVAEEGVNGSLTGSRASLNAVIHSLEQEFALASPLECRWTDVDNAPFQRMRVRLKKEIVALGRPDLRPRPETDTHIDPAAWNQLIADPDTLVVDTRNQYEIEVGTFPGAVDPGTRSFREFPDFAAKLDTVDRNRPLAMFCTGGIRCEKAVALMQELGFNEVYQLQGGILNYLETVPPAESQWQGECFVFDKRVALDHELAEGEYVQCHACRRPLNSTDLASPDYREGVSCPRCIGTLEKDRAVRLEERRKQVALARERGEAHVGARLD